MCRTHGAFVVRIAWELKTISSFIKQTVTVASAEWFSCHCSQTISPSCLEDRLSPILDISSISNRVRYARILTAVQSTRVLEPVIPTLAVVFSGS